MLDRPLTLRGGATLPNRAALAPLTNTQSHDDGTLGDDELHWLEARAAGGFGFVATCAAYLHPGGKAWQGQLGVADDAHLPGLTRLAAAVKAHGAFASVQLHHGGVQAALAPDGQRIAPAAGNGARAATEDDLTTVVMATVAAAQRAAAAGFDGVEIHGANGYLFTQFLAPADNPRTDRWGGDLEGRARLLRATMQLVRAHVPEGFAVGVRLSPVDTWAQRGLVLEDGVQVAKWMADDGADWVHLSLRSAWGPPPFEDTPTPVARAVRDALPDDVPVMAAGGIRTADDVQRALDAGVDLPAVGKAAIGYPDWPRRVADPSWTPAATPWSRAMLHDAAVSDRFLTYLERFAGLVEGGRPAR